MTSRRIRRSVRLAIIAGVATFSVLAGSMAGYAYWSASATASLGVGAGTLAISSTGFAPSTTTIGNATISAAGSTTLVTTGSIAFSNTTTTTSSQSQTLSVTFSRGSGSTVLAGATTLTVWQVANAASCTPSATPVAPVSGTWSSGVTVSRSLAPSATAVYCLRNTIADRQSASASGGTLTFAPQASATLSTGNFTKSASASGTVQTQYIYPLASISAGWWYYVTRASSTWCWDVSGSGSTSGSLLISYACKNNTDANQDFRFMDADGDGYVDIRPRHATGLRIDAQSSTTSGSAVLMITASASSASQQWQPQLVSSGVYQFVNKYSGLCLSMPAVSTGTATQTTCAGTSDQLFMFQERSVVPLTSALNCTNTGGSSNGRTVIFDWAADWAGGPYSIQVKKSGNAWTEVATAPQSGTSASLGTLGTSGWTTGTRSVQLVDNATGEVLDSTTIAVSRQGSSYYYARCS